MERLKNIFFGLCFLLFVSFFLETGRIHPPKNALVYVDARSYLFYPPHKAPEERTLLPMSYKIAKGSGAKPYRIDGFNVDGPIFIVTLLQKIGIWPFEHLTWTDAGAIEYFTEDQPNLDDSSLLEKVIFPTNYLSKSGGYNFPEHKNITYESIMSLCGIHTLEQLKYDFPKTSISEIIETTQKNEISHFRILSDMCLQQSTW